MKPFLPAFAAAGAALVITGCGTSSPAAGPTTTVTVTAPAGGESTEFTLSPAPAATTGPVGQATAACSSRYLNGTTGQTLGTAGSVYVNLILKNLNDVPCTMYGYPGVAQAAGTPLADIGRPSEENPTTPRELVTLAPGGSAYATLQIVDAGDFPSSVCTEVQSGWLAVIPPNQTAPMYIEYSSTACRGSAPLLMVTAMRPGTGS